MGYAVAEEFAQSGAKVFLISGPVNLTSSNQSIKIIKVESAEEMFNASVDVFGECDGAVLAAAVSDFTPGQKEPRKIKRGKEAWNLNLMPTKDIAAHLGEIKKEKQVLAGFALETENGLENAREKLAGKKLDFIVLNSPNIPGAGFNTDTNKVTIIDKYNNQRDFELKSKKEVARDIVEKMIGMMENR
jgi:phosphopantothenoylcysteine decarboxylase / phosphopantothenate---cysteine ligase